MKRVNAKLWMCLAAVAGAAVLVHAPLGANIIGDPAGQKPRIGSAEEWRNRPEREPIVADVSVIGSRTVPVERLMCCIATKPGQPFSEGRAHEDLMRLAASRLCKPVSVATTSAKDGRVNVVFSVRTPPNTVREVIYRHAKHVGIKDLEQITHVKAGMPLDIWANQAACYDIQQYLTDAGYFFANVSLEEGYDASHERVVFNITEGPLVRLRNLQFVGKTEFARAEKLRPLLDSDVLLGAQAGCREVDLLEKYFRSIGFLNVHAAREVNFSDDFCHVDFVFHILEGTRYRIGVWQIHNSTEASGEILAGLIGLKKGAYVSEAAVADDIARLKEYAEESGDSVAVRHEFAFDMDRPGEVCVHYYIEDPRQIMPPPMPDVPPPTPGVPLPLPIIIIGPGR